MKLDQLQHLVAIVEHGSLRAAARRLNLQQPALTRTVALMRGPQALPPLIEACFSLLQGELR